MTPLRDLIYMNIEQSGGTKVPKVVLLHTFNVSLQFCPINNLNGICFSPKHDPEVRSLNNRIGLSLTALERQCSPAIRSSGSRAEVGCAAESYVYL